MESNLNNNDNSASWIPQQNYLYEKRVVNSQDGRQQNPGLPQRGVGQKPNRAPEKMPKQRVLALANTLKRGLAIASLVSFGMFGGLVAFHQVGTTTQTSSATSQTKSTTSSSSKNNNSFLKQQGANTSGTSAASNTSTSGSNAASSTAVTGTHTS